MRRIGLWSVAVLVVAGVVYWGAGFYFDRLVRNGLDQAIRQLPPGYTVTYQSAHYAPLSRTAEVDGIELHVVLPSGSVNGRVATLELVRPNLQLGARWSEAVANPGAWAPDQALPVADQIRVAGVHFQSPLQMLEVDSERLEGTRLYPSALLHPGLPGLGTMLGGVGPTPLDTALDLLRLDAALSLGIGCDRWENIGFRASGRTPPNNAVPEQSFSYDIAQMTANGLDRGVWQNLAAEEIAFSSTLGGSAKFGRLSLSGVDLRQVSTRLLDAKEIVAALFDGLAIKRVEYADMTVAAKDGVPLSMEAFTLTDLAVADGEPASGALRMKGMRLSASQMTEPAQVAFFTQMGLDHVTIGLGFAFNRTAATGQVAIHDTYLKLDELGSVDLTADLEALPIGANPLGAKVTRATLLYHDASLVDRLLRQMAGGGDPEQARQQLILGMQQQAGVYGPDLTQAMVAFLQKPGSLTIELAPPEPLPLAALAVIKNLPRDQIPKLLGLRLQANQ